jgi:polyhydroxybutyrate depolymerase
MMAQVFRAAAMAASAAAATVSKTGCGREQWVPGETTSEELEDQGRTRQFQLHVPSGYDFDERTPVVLYFHGWGGSGNVNWVRPEADRSTFIAVAPQGIGGGANPDGGANSWNGGGSTDSSGGFGPPDASCAEGSPQYCYTSCAARPQGCHPCDWTTCNDDFAFASALLDWLEEALCVDPARVHVTGHSNGGQFASGMLTHGGPGAPLGPLGLAVS